MKEPRIVCVLAQSEPEYVGKMPLRSDIVVLPADDPKLLKKIGFSVEEKIGIGVVNPRGVAIASKITVVDGILNEHPPALVIRKVTIVE
jgi:hypothetical protein